MLDTILGEPRYTRTEVARRAGVPLERATALWRAMGFAEVPDDAVTFTDRDVEALAVAESLRALGVVDDAGLLALTRTMAQAMSRLAVSHAAVAAPYLDSADTLLPAVSSLIDFMWRRHLLVAASSLLAEPSAGSVAVGFVDLVGFTSMSRSSSPEELASVVESFEHAAAQHVADAGGRIVKTLGDEVLFVAPTAADGAALALRLAGLEHEVRVGLAYGPVVDRLGDVFGPTVNIASRLTGLAFPGTVLVDREAARALRDDAAFNVAPIKRQAVRGYSHLAPYRLRAASG